mmetsp:Transcript_74907/g.156165  ORF Transcript_74907/g.156165 Transcript_74907/m.156165 type:complete len:451 (-) Transcript_74907:862-2214(-)
MGLQGKLRPSRPPGLHQERLGDQDIKWWHVSQVPGCDHSGQQRESIQGVDTDASAQDVVEDALFLRPLKMCVEEHEPREHEEPRNPGEAPAEPIDLVGDALGIDMADDDMQGCAEASKAQGELVTSLASSIPGTFQALSLTNNGVRLLGLGCDGSLRQTILCENFLVLVVDIASIASRRSSTQFFLGIIRMDILATQQARQPWGLTSQILLGRLTQLHILLGVAGCRRNVHTHGQELVATGLCIQLRLCWHSRVNLAGWPLLGNLRWHGNRAALHLFGSSCGRGTTRLCRGISHHHRGHFLGRRGFRPLHGSRGGDKVAAGFCFFVCLRRLTRTRFISASSAGASAQGVAASVAAIGSLSTGHLGLVLLGSHRYFSWFHCDRSLALVSLNLRCGGGLAEEALWHQLLEGAQKSRVPKQNQSETTCNQSGHPFDARHAVQGIVTGLLSMAS